MSILLFKHCTLPCVATVVMLAGFLLGVSRSFADFPVAQTSGTDITPAVAYNSTDREYLVVWLGGGGAIVGQRVSEAGVVTGSPIGIAANSFGRPSVVYNAAQNQYLVAYVEGTSMSYGIYGRVLDHQGGLLGSATSLMAGGSCPKVLYNSLAGTYLLLGMNSDLYSRKIGANGQGTAAAVNLTSNVSVDYTGFAAAYAPVTSTATPTGRYLVATYAVNLMMLDSDGKPLSTLENPSTGAKEASIPFKTGTVTGGEYNVDVAYGDTSGYSMWGKAFLVVWSDNNNKWQGTEWTGIYGGYLDPEKIDYKTTDPVVNNAFPISYVYGHWAYSTYAASWKPVVAFNPVARKFQVAWRETPTTDASNDTKVPHIRANAGFFKAPSYSNIVLSATNGTEDPVTPAIAASTTSPASLVVWDDLRNQSATGHDIYGSLYNIAGPVSTGLVVVNTLDSGPGSLRQAILDANLSTGADSISFAVPKSDPGYQAATGVWTIRPLTPLPEIISDGTLINGLSQSAFGGDPNPMGPEIEIDGSLAGNPADGLRIRSFWSGVWGITINRFQGNGIFIMGPNAGATLVIRSYIGVSANATAKAPNLGAGIRISHSPLNFLGFFDTLSTNVIGGNAGGGIVIEGSAARFNVVLVSRIGTDLSHAMNLGNGGDGILFRDSACDNAVTGYAFPKEVVVANNDMAGIHVDGSGTVRNLLAAGCIFSNGGPGIALTNGGNGMKAAPVITHASTTQITGVAAPHNMVFLYNDQTDEGREYFDTVFADGLGNFAWSGTAKGPHVTAVAVDTAAGATVNNTSPFSSPNPLTDIREIADESGPRAFLLAQNYPNPFNPTTTIRYGVGGSESGSAGSGRGGEWVKLSVCDVLGREVAVLVNERKDPGHYSLQFDGSLLASGVYLCRMEWMGTSLIQKMMLVR
ncbi:MAG TPA: hypothetical protein VLT13_12515 [Bacteroidota bacterium]|nr:hypothetical protein [Bacteroidota bacterium]